jgi:hypothetical protein
MTNANERKAMKTKTVDQLCNSEAGTFKKFIKQKEDYLQSVENERKERIRASRKTSRELSWAA